MAASNPSPPAWMEPAPAMPETRRGHSAMAARSGLNTLVFFGLIVFVVAAAGIGGVMIWGPEKAVKNRTQFATNPPPPTELPSLPASADAPTAPPVASAEGEATQAPTDSATTSANDAPPKKGKKGLRVGGKRH